MVCEATIRIEFPMAHVVYEMVDVLRYLVKVLLIVLCGLSAKSVTAKSCHLVIKAHSSL